jgi:DNA-binding HxlR family transcriptional regulator
VRHSSLHSADCPIARGVAVLGERWTLLILREAFSGARRFEDYQARTGIARNILSDRLRALVEHGILDRRPYAEHPGRTLYQYRLTEKGMELYPILVTLIEWGTRHGEFEQPPIELVHKNCGNVTHPRMTCSECGEPIDPREMRAQAGSPAAV